MRPWRNTLNCTLAFLLTELPSVLTARGGQAAGIGAAERGAISRELLRLVLVSANREAALSNMCSEGGIAGGHGCVCNLYSPNVPRFAPPDARGVRFHWLSADELRRGARRTLTYVSFRGFEVRDRIVRVQLVINRTHHGISEAPILWPYVFERGENAWRGRMDPAMFIQATAPTTQPN